MENRKNCLLLNTKHTLIGFLIQLQQQQQLVYTFIEKKVRIKIGGDKISFQNCSVCEVLVQLIIALFRCLFYDILDCFSNASNSSISFHSILCGLFDFHILSYFAQVVMLSWWMFDANKIDRSMYMYIGHPLYMHYVLFGWYGVVLWKNSVTPNFYTSTVYNIYSTFTVSLSTWWMQTFYSIPILV